MEHFVRSYFLFLGTNPHESSKEHFSQDHDGLQLVTIVGERSRSWPVKGQGHGLWKIRAITSPLSHWNENPDLDEFNFWVSSLILFNSLLPSHWIQPSHKSHNASDKYPTMHHFVTEMCTRVHISVTKWWIVGYGMDAFWDLWDGSSLNTKPLMQENGLRYPQQTDSLHRYKIQEECFFISLTQWGLSQWHRLKSQCVKPIKKIPDEFRRRFVIYSPQNSSS